MGRSAKRSAGAQATLTGGIWGRQPGAGLYRRPTVVLARSPVVCWPPSARGAYRAPADGAGP